MSDQPTGQGYWLASDGKWYPPQRYPPPAPLPPPAPVGRPSRGRRRTPTWLKVVAASTGILLVGVIAIIAAAPKTQRATGPPLTTTTGPDRPIPTSTPLATSISGDSGHVSASDLEAFDVCKQFVTKGLKAPLGAVWRDPRGNQVTYLGPGVDGEITVMASVDSQNSFGAKIRSSYECSVTPTGGHKWHLQDLQVN